MFINDVVGWCGGGFWDGACACVDVCGLLGATPLVGNWKLNRINWLFLLLQNQLRLEFSIIYFIQFSIIYYIQLYSRGEYL